MAFLSWIIGDGQRKQGPAQSSCSTSVHLLQMIIWAQCCNPNLQIREQELGKICWVPHERDRYATFYDNPMLIFEVLNMLQNLLRLFVKSHPFLPLETVAIDDDYANLSSPPPLNKLQSVADNYGWCRFNQIRLTSIWSGKQIELWAAKWKRASL